MTFNIIWGGRGGEHKYMVNVTIMEPGTKFNLEHGCPHFFCQCLEWDLLGQQSISGVWQGCAPALSFHNEQSCVWYRPFPPTAVFQLSRFSAQTWKRYEGNNQPKSNILELGPILSALLWGDVWCFLPKHERDPLGSRFSSTVVPSRWLLGVAKAPTEFLRVRKTKWVKWKQRLLGL